MKHYFRLILLIGLLLSLSLTLPLAAQEEGGPPQVGLRPDAPTYAQHGPYWVGVYEFTLEAVHREQPLQMVAWYPALNPEGTEEAVTYSGFIRADTEDGYPIEIAGRALRDATPDMGAAPYPVILLSHGFINNPFMYAWLGEHLTSHGFVVLAPIHREVLIFPETEAELLEQFSLERVALIRRFLDMGTIFANLDMLNQDGFLAGMMNTDVIGITGHSYGGMTTLAAGGARLALDEFAARCARLPEGDSLEGACRIWLDDRERLAEEAGFEAEPEGLWPAWTDPRVKAIAPLAGDSHAFGESGLAAIVVPMLAMNGSIDTGTVPEWGALPAYRNASSAEKSLVIFDNAEHMIFGTECVDAPLFIEWDAFGVCSDPVWDMRRVHDLINHLDTAFFLAELKGDTEARAALAPENVQFPGVQYEATGF